MKCEIIFKNGSILGSITEKWLNQVAAAVHNVGGLVAPISG